MKALIMAGGKGTRLRPLTCDIPKPMVPVLNKPVMEYSIELLKKYQVNEIAVTMAYLPSVIMDYFGSGQEWGVNLRYYTEEVPLGTGGSVKNAEDFLDDTFLVISGDALTDINLQKAIDFHKTKKSKATLILKKESIPLEYGIIITDDDGRIVRFLEKPSWGEVFSDTVNTGIYILEPEVLDYYQKGENFDFSKDLFPKLLKDNIPMYGYITDDYWNDIGDIRSYMQTHFDVLDGKARVKIRGKEIEKGIWLDEGAELGENVYLESPVHIGKNCLIKDNADLQPYTFIGNGCIIGEETAIKRSVIGKNSVIGRNTNCTGSVVCSNVRIKNRVNILEGSAIGSGSILSNGVVVKPNIKIWPDKKIEEDMIVNQNLVWGTKASRAIFGHKDISGDINIEITPEFASRLGSAYASSIGGEKTIVVSNDCSNASNIIKNSIVSGILSTGANVIDIQKAVMPMNRFATRQYGAVGGVHVRSDHCERNRIHIEFVNGKGANLDRNTERKIAHLFHREDFERCNAEKMETSVEISNFASFYMRVGAKAINDISKIKRENPKIIVSSRCKNIMELATQFLEYIGCQVQCEYEMSHEKTIEGYLKSISKKIKKQKADMGILIGENGENLVLIDDTGRIIEKERYTVLATLILLKMGMNKKIVVPYTSPKAIEDMAKKYNAQIIRSKTSPAEIMNAILNIGNNEGESFIQYIFYFDAILAAAKIIDFLVQNSFKLSDIVDEIPVFYFVKEEVSCDWKDKGRIIKEIIVDYKEQNMDMELFEGVKINNNKGWALILPDSERPVFNVYAESFSEEYAQELSASFSQKIEELMKNGEIE